MSDVNKEELTIGIYEAYQDVIRSTEELLDLLKIYLEPATYDYIRQQNIVRLRITRDSIHEAIRQKNTTNSSSG
jgi:S-adenosylmethionine:diacylglycerol 3-amino-3-carboxypropyl transferase